MTMRTSSTVTDSMSNHVDVVLFEYDGLFADSVAARMSAVFLSMTSWYCFTVKHVYALGLFSPINEFTCHQIRREIPAADRISVFQYDDVFCLASLRLKRSDVLQAALDYAFLLAGVPFASQSDTPRQTTADDDVHELGIPPLVLIHPAVL